MEILEDGIEANPSNFTRFAVIGREQIKHGPFEKSCLVFSTGHQPGSPCAVLTVFAENGINLAKLESRPIPGEPWKYMFYANIEADAHGEFMAPVMSALAEKTEYLRVSGVC